MRFNYLHELLNWLVCSLGYSSYLEIGCADNNTFNAIKATVKVGVDSQKGGTHRMTSDEFFASNEETFDVIFIDGDHHHDTVSRDIQNALSVLNLGGTIVLHDLSPGSRAMERPTANGTAWRAFMVYRDRPDLTMITLNFNHGVGLMRRGRNDNPVSVDLTMDELTFEMLDENRDEWLDLRSPEGETVQRWLDSIEEYVPVAER